MGVTVITDVYVSRLTETSLVPQ